MDIFDKICRTCNNERKNMINIFESKLLAKSKNIDEMLSCCNLAPARVDDGYPKQICYLCAKQLEISYKFITQCNKSKVQFDKIIGYMKSNFDDYIYEEQEEPEQLNLISVIEEDISVESMENHGLDNGDYEKQSYEVETATRDGCTKQKNTGTCDVMIPAVTSAHSINMIYTEECETTESESRIACPSCSKRFFTAKALTLHQKLTHKNPSHNTKLFCSNCEKTFINRNLFVLHRKYCKFSTNSSFTAQNVGTNSLRKPN